MTTPELLQALRLAERGVVALERIADAIEAANASDPLLAITKALEADGVGSAEHIATDPNADMPDHIRRLLAR